MNNSLREVIVEVGAEGGILTVIGERTPFGWSFILATVDQSLVLIDEGGEVRATRGKASAWRGALKLLDAYPWHRLYPLHVHPEFAGRILRAVKLRLARENLEYSERQLEEWMERCRHSVTATQIAPAIPEANQSR